MYDQLMDKYVVRRVLAMGRGRDALLACRRLQGIDVLREELVRRCNSSPWFVRTLLTFFVRSCLLLAGTHHVPLHPLPQAVPALHQELQRGSFCTARARVLVCAP